MIKKMLVGGAVAMALSLSSSLALEVNLYVDSAPNSFGSPAYSGWWANAQKDAIDGTFVNMANSVNSANSGSTVFELKDHVVYSFDDLGRRLHFVYWIPNTTIQQLKALNFQVGLDYQWAGGWNDLYNEVYSASWLTPGSWIERDGGVIGTAGHAWWGAHGVDTQEALKADLDAWRPYVGDVKFRVQWKEDGTYVGDTLIATYNAPHGVPEAGSTLGMAGFALMALGFLGRRLKS